MGSLRNLRFELLERRELLYAGVNPILEIQTTVGNIEVEMLEDDAPQTVANFLNYVDDGDYQDAIFHRLVSDFVLQGGGFSVTNNQICDSKCDPEDVDPDQFSEIPTDDPVVNEFGVSNLRGTIAMAKRGGDPDSATNQFFFNLNDNSANLDNQNGGFTVFARALDMALIDEIAALDVMNLSSIFDASDPRSAISAAPSLVTSEFTRLIAIQGFGGSGVVHGTNYLDINRNGQQDAGEGGRSGLTVYNDANNNLILDPEETSTISDELGNWHMFIPNSDIYRLRTIDFTDYQASGAALQTGIVNIGRSKTGVNFGTVYEGTSFHNEQLATDVDGVNQVSPLDALLVINELSEREYSSADGKLVELEAPLNSPRFLDVDADGSVSPLDAIAVINVLNEMSAAPLGIRQSADSQPIQNDFVAASNDLAGHERLTDAADTTDRLQLLDVPGDADQKAIVPADTPVPAALPHSVRRADRAIEREDSVAWIFSEFESDEFQLI